MSGILLSARLLWRSFHRCGRLQSDRPSRSDLVMAGTACSVRHRFGDSLAGSCRYSAEQRGLERAYCSSPRQAPPKPHLVAAAASLGRDCFCSLAWCVRAYILVGSCQEPSAGNACNTVVPLSFSRVQALFEIFLSQPCTALRSWTSKHLAVSIASA